MSIYKLQYFNGRGAAEIIRYLFAASGQSYEDYRYNFSFPNFEKPEFDADSAAGEFRANMDRLPILTYNGSKLGQSKTIERFLAKKFGLFGADEIEAAQIDAITEHVRDIKQKYNDAKAKKSGDEQNAAKAAFVSDELPKWLDKLQNSVGTNGFAVGSKLSLADLTLFHLLRDYFDDKDAVNALVADRSTLLTIVRHAEEPLKHWLETRPVTPF